MEQMEFNSFLLHLGNELESNEFEALKFVLKGYVTSSKCEEMVQVFKYFEEMERLCLLSPTNFLVLKIALGLIGRPDLVKKIEGKEVYFATLFGETIKDDREDCDLVCDGIKEAAVHLAKFFLRSGQNTCEMHKKLKLIGSEKNIDFQLQEIAEELQAGAEDQQMTLATPELSEIKENDLSDVTTPSISSLHPVETGKVKHKALGSDKVKENLLESKTEQKKPSRETVSDGNHLEDFNSTSETPDKMKAGVTTGAPSPHTTMLPSTSSITELDDDIVTDGGEEGKENMRAGSNKLDDEGMPMNSSKQVSESDSYGHKDQMFPVDPSPLLNSYESPTTDSPQLQLKSYKKKGYSVAISNGSLCECTCEKGVVLMENGTTFAIAITNSNDYAAEVDVTFGGRYLGLWSVDAQQTNPLIIEGSAWEKGKLTFTSDSPECMPSSKGHPVDWVESRFSGKIELEFKPEAMALFVQHVRYNKKHETLLTGFKEATVDDLKVEINRTLWECLGIVSCLIRDGKVLEEQNTVRSYSLKDGDIIQVLTNEEPMSVEPLGMDAFTIRVDPRHDSCKRVMNAIAEKMNVPIKQQRLQLNGEDLKETDSLVTMFLKSKKPVIKVVTDMNINIIVHLPSQEVKKISISWFTTVDELQKELQIPHTDAILKLGNKEIYGNGSKQLIDLGIKNGSEITVVSAQQKENRAPATHRGIKLSSLRKPGTTRGFRGFGDFEFHAPVSNTRGFSSESRALPDPLEEDENSDDIQEDASMTFHQNELPAGLREGTCFLRGEELFANQFQLDTLERKFAKDKQNAVTLIIQLCSKSTVGSHEPQ